VRYDCTKSDCGGVLLDHNNATKEQKNKRTKQQNNKTVKQQK
jgi:hypothetical protein